MRTSTLRKHFACLDIVMLACIAFMSASSVQLCLSGHWRHQAPAAMPARMLCTSPLLPLSSIPGLQAWPWINLSGKMCGILSLSFF